MVVGGAIIGHDGALATLEIREFGRQSPDYLMVLVFPVAAWRLARRRYLRQPRCPAPPAANGRTLRTERRGARASWRRVAETP